MSSRWLKFEFAILLLSIVWSANGQTGYFNVIHPPGDNNADVIETDSSYVVFQQGNPPVNDLHLHHFTKSGSFVKSDSFSFNYFYESAVNGLCEYKGGYLKLATMFVNPDTFWVHLIHFDHNLDTLQTLNYSHLNQLSTQAISVHYFAPNTIIISGMYLVRAGIRAHGYVLALDTNLNVKWEQTYVPANLNAQGGFEFYDIAGLTNGGFFIGGQRVFFDANGLSRRKGVIMKIDGVGQEIWREELDGPEGNHKVLVEEIDDSSAAFFTTRIDVPDSQPFTQLRFGVVDNNGIQVDTTIGGLVRNMTPDFFEWSPKIGFVGGGFAQGLGFKSYAVNINPFGSINWRREYFNGNQIGVDRGYLESMTFTQDSGMLFTGYFMDRGGGNGANIWLVKTDSLGCDTPGCENIGLEELMTSKQPRIQLYPNPAKEAVSLSFGSSIVQNYNEVEIQLFNIQGKLIMSQVLQLDLPELSLELSDVPKGLYSVEVLSSGRKIGCLKLVVD